MSGLYLYAVVGRGPAAPLGRGLAGEALSVICAGDVVAVVGEMPEAPAATSEAVRAHDAVVRRLAEASEAILPARFGPVHEAAALADRLAATSADLAEALRLVAGREQMTLHLFDPPEGSPGRAERGGDMPEPGAGLAGEDSTGSGPGTRYLAERQRHWRRRERLPELEPLRPHLDALIAAERVELRATPPLRASVYHLIDRGRGAEYRQAVEDHLDLVAGVRVRVSGPWAPYAFASAGGESR
jgi:hypothetical protein